MAILQFDIEDENEIVHAIGELDEERRPKLIVKEWERRSSACIGRILANIGADEKRVNSTRQEPTAKSEGLYYS